MKSFFSQVILEFTPLFCLTIQSIFPRIHPCMSSKSQKQNFLKRPLITKTSYPFSVNFYFLHKHRQRPYPIGKLPIQGLINDHFLFGFTMASNPKSLIFLTFIMFIYSRLEFQKTSLHQSSSLPTFIYKTFVSYYHYKMNGYKIATLPFICTTLRKLAAASSQFFIDNRGFHNSRSTKLPGNNQVLGRPLEAQAIAQTASPCSNLLAHRQWSAEALTPACWARLISPP